MLSHLLKYKLRVVVFVTILFCSCDLSNSQPVNLDSDKISPAGTGYTIRMVYTDSTRVKAILEAPLYLDYSNLSLPYSEFPEGLKVTFLDEFMNENIVLADFGTLYNSTKIIDLVGNVSLTSSDGSILNTEQLYWDASNDWIFTEREFRFVGSEYNVLANRLDTNKEFTKFQTGKLTGTVAVKEETGPE
ncbi:MAG: LPS export ABC transporter protein LptC [Candidatus Arcticimaribacter sp.]|jgi:LPS export ABC transporter protein LptC